MPKKSNAGHTTAPQKRRSIPKVYADTKGAWQDIGSFRFTENAGVLSAHWAASSGQELTAAFFELCNDPALAEARLELGELVGNIAERAAQNALTSIPGPIEAMAEASRLQRQASSWRHWARVPAGYMIFPKTKRT